jgi:hypothetical protein
LLVGEKKYEEEQLEKRYERDLPSIEQLRGRETTKNSPSF